MRQTNRGFASMDQNRRRQLASKGGRAAHLRGTAHEWTPAEAREAGRKGGAILLSSGEDASTSRINDIAETLNDVATKLDEMTSGRPTISVLAGMRQSIETAGRALDRLERGIKRRNGTS